MHRQPTTDNRQPEHVDLAIIGAGAAGLTAAIFAAREAPDARIVALDGAPRIGAKILISGGGRCNVTHDVVGPEDFHGNRNAVAKVLRTFPVGETVAWFREMGVELKREETGKLFPTTDRARTVIDALLRACGAEVRTGARVIRVVAGPSPGAPRHPLPAQRGEGERGGGGVGGEQSEPPPPSRSPSPRLRGEGARTADEGPSFTIETSTGVLHARRVILATGGRSVPKTGSDGHGYTLARTLGHTVTDVFPALVPLLVEPGFWTTELSGTSVVAELSVRTATGRVIARDRGSMLLTHFGFSGPAVLDVSRDLLAARRDDPGAQLVVNFLPEETFESLERTLLDEAKRNPRATPASVLRGRLPERVLDHLAPSIPIANLRKEERRRVVRGLVETTLPVSRDRGFDFAEVTAGGVPLTEVDVATMASRVCEGLYLCGEILDVDGKIGGYNFQWAWASGRLAGLHAVAR